MRNIKVNVYSPVEADRKVTLSGAVFGVEVNTQVMFDAVQVYQSNMRQATAKTKTRDEVSGGGKKPWRQKGTGRARAGSTRSPIWVGGGVALGPDGNQSYKLSQNKKAHKLALKSALTLKVKEKELKVFHGYEFAGKTKEAVKFLTAIKAEKKVLLVTADDLLIQAANNLPNVILRTVGNISVYDLLNANHLVISEDDIKTVEEALK
jgi:large subunit ribosomal protein L4